MGLGLDHLLTSGAESHLEDLSVVVDHPSGMPTLNWLSPSPPRAPRPRIPARGPSLALRCSAGPLFRARHHPPHENLLPGYGIYERPTEGVEPGSAVERCGRHSDMAPQNPAAALSNVLDDRAKNRCPQPSSSFPFFDGHASYLPAIPLISERWLSTPNRSSRHDLVAPTTREVPGVRVLIVRPR